MYSSLWPNGRTRYPFLALIPLLGVIALIFAWHGHTLAAITADCTNGNFSGTYQDEDVTLSGDLYVTNNVLVRNNVTVTLEAGTNVTMCGAYRLRVEGGGNLVAVGTQAQPITFEAVDPDVHWDAIQFLGEANHSTLRHVVLNHGGGDDPSAAKGSVEFLNLAANPMPSPTLDHVTINDSGAYGLYLQVNPDDATPPSISNVTINNSANAAVLSSAPALGGFGSGNTYTNNTPNTIQVLAGGASRIFHSQTWRNQGVPFEMLGQAMVASAAGGDPFPTLTVEPGVTFLMHPNAELNIGTSLGRGASLVAEGTVDAPITFTRLNESSAPWRRLHLQLYPEAYARLQHVAFSYGGSVGLGMIEQIGEGTLILDHVTTSQSLSAGLHARGSVSVNDSAFELNQTGLEFWFTADAVVRNSVIRNNIEGGLHSLDTGGNFNRNCIDAIGNFWGSPDGPADSHDQADACGNARTNTGAGDSVSGGVLYEPWLPGDGPLLDRGTIQPDEFYVIANGVDSTAVTIRLRDSQGNPLSGKQVQLNSTVGTVAQPDQPTDANGVTTAVISSTTPGFAYLSASNLTDGAPIAGLGGITFWQGAGDAGGLIGSGGAPFASPQLIISGKPFQVGNPVGMRVPMQNSNPHPVDVTVIYSVSNFGIGVGFTPVYTATATLQPGESWDAQGVWLPVSTGHRCIQATISVNNVLVGAVQALAQNTLARQQNTDQNPCDPNKLDPGQLIPKTPGGGLIGVGRQFYMTYNLGQKTNNCLDKGLSYDQMGSLNIENERDYEEIITPPVYTPPPISADGDLTPEQATALNNLAQSSAHLLSLNQALGATAQRLNWAAQAGELHYVDLQYQAYRDFTNQYATTLDLFADQIDELLSVLDGVNDTYYLAEDFQATRDELASNGFDAEERSYYQQAGLPEDLISELEQDLVAGFDTQAPQSIGFGTALTEIQADSRNLANRLRSQYPTPTFEQQQGFDIAGQQVSLQTTTVFVPPQVFSFEVGHPFTGQQTVDLVVRPVSLPLGWTYALNRQNVTVDEGETIEVALTLYPGNDLLEGDLVQVTVEGYVDGELIGGILMEYLTPHLTPRSLFHDLYLPVLLR